MSIPDDLPALTARAARLWPERTAWVFDTGGPRQDFTFAEVHARSDAYAAMLAGHGVSEGDRVAVMLRNRPEFPLLWLGAAKLGAILVSVNVTYRELDGAHVLTDSGARLVVAESDLVPMLRAIAGRTAVAEISDVDDRANATFARSDVPNVAFVQPDPAPDRPANLQYTSGTTGEPKGCVLPHRYWTTLARGLVREHPNLGPDDVMLTAQPFHYIDPQWNVTTGLAAGARLVVLDRFHPTTFWSKVREHDVTWFYCLGMMPTLLLRQPPSEADRDHRVRAVHASSIPLDKHAELEARWGVPWFEAFGMTETGADLRVRPEYHDETVGTGCIGTPARSREVRISADGELLIRGEGMMLGYYGRDAETARVFRDGWFHTGDLATMDSHGRVYYVGRTKDMIRRSGENISADEVERALLQHSGVRIAAVIAVPDEIRGEEVKALVVPADPALDPAELAEHCAARLAYFKVPRYWSLVDDLPMTSSERVAKGQLDRTSKGAYDRAEQVWR